MSKLEIVRGTSFPLRIDVQDADGNPLALGESDTLLLGVKPVLGGERVLMKKATADASGGGYLFDLRPEDTVGLSPMEYLYDVNLRIGANFHNVIPLSELTIIDSTTEMGDADG
jgi:hypothetical protein